MVIFLLTILFVVIGISVPLALMWAADGFPDQRPAPVWAKQAIKFSISACLFTIGGVAALLTFKAYREVWWIVPVCALICGTCVSAIIGINTYRGD